MEAAFEILRMILPATAVFVAVWLIVKGFLDNEQDRRSIELKKSNQSAVTPLRLQAYERIVIFLERINPNSLVIRVNKQNFNAHQLHMELIKSIKSEYEHNLSQQIYMSYAAWELVKNSKEEIIKLINMSATKIAHDAPGSDLAMMILNITANLDKKLPSEMAIEFIKKEVNQSF